MEFIRLCDVETKAQEGTVIGCGHEDVDGLRPE